MTNDKDIDSLLAKYLAEETDSIEENLFDEWLEESDEHQKIWTQSKKIWEDAGCIQGKQSVDVDCAWNKVKTCMFESKKVVQADTNQLITPLPTKKIVLFKTIARVAASIILLVGLVFLGYQYVESTHLTPTSTTVQLTSNQQLIEKTLPDGTRIRLTKNSTLSYPSRFDGATREVTLVGEAFFDVHHNNAQPFIIHAQSTDIRVLGTSFNVNATNADVQVAVKTGRVQFSNDKQRIILVANESASFSSASNSIRKTSNPEITQKATFVFEHTPLKEVVAQLSNRFDINISLESSNSGNCELSATFENENIETIVSIIATTFDLTSNKTQDGYLLSGKGCK